MSLSNFFSSILLLNVAVISIALTSCDGTFTHRGQSSEITELNLSDDQQQTESCYAVCNQINPDEGCGRWLKYAGNDCLNQLERK